MRLIIIAAVLLFSAPAFAKPHHTKRQHAFVSRLIPVELHGRCFWR